MSEDRRAHVKDRIKQISHVLDTLRQQAESDDVVTPDEQDLLENIQENIDRYRQLAQQVMADDDISDDDLERLYVFEKQIVQGASSQALLDGEITGEESDLLQKLLDFFTNLNDEVE